MSVCAFRMGFNENRQVGSIGESEAILTLTPLFALQVLLAPWGHQAFQVFPRRSPYSLGSWVPKAGEAFPVHRERSGLRALLEIQVGLRAWPL